MGHVVEGGVAPLGLAFLTEGCWLGPLVAQGQATGLMGRQLSLCQWLHCQAGGRL